MLQYDAGIQIKAFRALQARMHRDSKWFQRSRELTQSGISINYLPFKYPMRICSNSPILDWTLFVWRPGDGSTK